MIEIAAAWIIALPLYVIALILNDILKAQKQRRENGGNGNEQI